MEYNNLYVSLIENDLNPFILFDSNGKIKDFNKEAEFLFNVVNPKELYELAVAHATLSFGFKREFMSLKYGKSSYYAILVGYINDDEIGLRLYKEVCVEQEVAKIQNIELANIFSLIEISKSTVLLQSDIDIEEIYDISIPQIKINISKFLLILNECFAIFKSHKQLQIKIYIKIGEYELIQGKKYQVISIEFISKDNCIVDKSLIEKALKVHINIFEERCKIKLEFPMIL